MNQKSTNVGISPVIGIILITAIAVTLVSFAAVQVFDIAEKTSAPVQASYNLNEKGDSATLKVVSSEDVRKFLLYADGSLIYQTKEQTFTKKVDGGGVITFKAINNETGNEELLLREEIDTSISNGVLLPDGTFINKNGEQTLDFSVNPEALGSLRFNYVGGSGRDLAYIDNSGDLVIKSDSGDETTLVESSDSASPRDTKTTISGGEWEGSDSLFYVGNDKKIYRVDSSGTPSLVANPSNDANAISDITDIDNDDKDEFIFADGSQRLRYIEQDGSITDLGVTVGSNNGIGVSTNAGDFDSDGIPRVATVDGSNNIVLVGEAETDETISKADAKKAPISALDIDNDNTPEVIYTDSSSNELKYVDNVDTSKDVKNILDEEGNAIDGDGESGIVSG